MHAFARRAESNRAATYVDEAVMKLTAPPYWRLRPASFAALAHISASILMTAAVFPGDRTRGTLPNYENRVESWGSAIILSSSEFKRFTVARGIQVGPNGASQTRALNLGSATCATIGILGHRGRRLYRSLLHSPGSRRFSLGGTTGMKPSCAASL